MSKSKSAAARWAIMGIDPGGTTGVAWMVIDAHTKKQQSTPIRYFRAEQFEHPPRTNNKRVEGQQIPADVKLMIEQERGVGLTDHYAQYLPIARYLAQRWMVFRRIAVGNLKTAPARTILAIEDWTFGNPDQRKEQYAAVFITHLLRGILDGLAYAYEFQGYGPAHSEVHYVLPAQKLSQILDGPTAHNRLEGAGLLIRDFSKSRRGKILEHANDATLIAIAAGQHCKLPELLKPYDGDPRPDPFALAIRPVDVDTSIPVHTGFAKTHQPGDPPHRLSRRAKGRALAGQTQLARRQRSSKTLTGGFLGGVMKENPLFVEYLMQYRVLNKKDLKHVLPKDVIKFVWNQIGDPDHGYARDMNGKLIRTNKLLKICHAAIEESGGMKAFRERARAETPD